MNKQLIVGLSILALFAVADVAAAEKGGGGAPGATTGANPGNDGGANMGAGKESPGASDRGSSPGSSSERGMSSEKGAASEQRSEKGADKGSSKDKSSDRAQSFDKDKSTKGAAKDSDSSKSDRAGKEKKDTSSGAASGESGKPGSTTAESRSEPGKSHVSLNQEQRTRVQSAFKSHLGSAKVDVKIEPRIGIAVPRNVTLFDIPEDVVIIVPEWRRYKYVLIGDEICIVDLDTYEIVEVVAAV